MWILKKLDGETYPLYTRSEHIIGRFGSLELSSDASVSRRHASIQVTLKKGIVKLVLKDLGSKYGTYLNEGITLMNAMPKLEPVEIKIGDRIRFGMQNNIWELEESRFVVCTSLLSSQDKANLQTLVTNLDGQIVSNWSIDCTHLIMTHIKTTVKAICALAQVRPIVSLEYWKHLGTVFSKSVESPLPDCDEFVPPIAEPQLKLPCVSMKMNKNRRFLFQGFKFIAFGRTQLNNILPIIEAAGGTALDGNRFEVSENELCDEKVVVVQTNCNEASSSNVFRVLNILNSHGLRPVKETEIYLSMVECSVEKFCNPRYDASVLLRQPESQITVKSEPIVLAPETQDTVADEDTQFLETASGNFSLYVNEKIVFSDDDEDIIPGTDPSIISNTPTDSMPSTKRKRLDNIECTLKTKTARLDNWLIDRKVSPKNTSESSASESLFSASAKTNKNALKDLFSFRATKKDTDKASSSLFGTNNDSCQQSASVPKDKQKGSRTSTLFAAACSKPSDIGDGKVSRTASLFGNVNSLRSSRNSSLLFSAVQDVSVSKNSLLGKRKSEDEIGSGAKSNSRTASLFKCKVTGSNVIDEEVILDSDDESDLIARTTSKLAIVNDASSYQDSPVDIPSKVSLSQFQSAVTKENITHVKMEANGSMGETLDKSIVHTIPLVQNNSQNIQARPVNNLVTNFKKFRKNHVCYPPSSNVGRAKLILFSGAVGDGFQDD